LDERGAVKDFLRRLKVKTIIAGSRTFNCFEEMKYILDNSLWQITEVVSGTARGADLLGGAWAKINNIDIKRFPASWDKYGKYAGYRRNEDMAKYADALIAFHDGDSKGTQHMIDLANKYKLHIFIFNFKDHKFYGQFQSRKR